MILVLEAAGVGWKASLIILGSVALFFGVLVFTGWNDRP